MKCNKEFLPSATSINLISTSMIAKKLLEWIYQCLQHFHLFKIFLIVTFSHSYLLNRKSYLLSTLLTGNYTIIFAVHIFFSIQGSSVQVSLACVRAYSHYGKVYFGRFLEIFFKPLVYFIT